MGKSKVNKKAKSVTINANSNREFFFIHGYTGSPTDFNQIGLYLNKRFNANIKIFRLIGHGEKIENIKDLKYIDFLNQARKELVKDLKKKRKIIVGGISVGSLIAMQLSSEYDVKGVINISTPYKSKFFIGLISFLEPFIFKKTWKKPIPEYESELRKNAFFYDLNIRGLNIIKHAKKQLKKQLKKIIAPCLIIHVSHDYLFDIKGARYLKENISSKISELHLLETEKKASHNPFYTSKHVELYKIIGDFVEKHDLFNRNNANRLCPEFQFIV